MKISYAAATAVIAIGLIAPSFAFADTASDLQAQIQSLLAQLHTLQQQLMALTASSTPATANGDSWKWSTSTPPVTSDNQMPGKPMCVNLTRNLHQGAEGDDVREMQQMLANSPEADFHGAATGFFGPLTAQAMANFQMHQGIASSTDGSVGPMTRAFFERQCGNGGMGDGMISGGQVSGTITANSGTSITIQNRDGNSVTVNVTASTSIMVINGTSTAPTAGTMADLIVGKMAGADGPKNSDGSITAMHINVGTLPPPVPLQMMNGGDGHGEHAAPMMPQGSNSFHDIPHTGAGDGQGEQGN